MYDELPQRHEYFSCESDNHKSSINAKQTYSGALPTGRDRRWLKKVDAEAIATYRLENAA